jgi:hypothetical protein
MQRVHFLHIGKTAGTAMRHALSPYLTCVRGTEIVLHPHETTLADIPIGEKAVFVLRNPVDRFVSGFNSRHRRGPPHHVDWNLAEATAFKNFATPNDLAAGLSASDAGERVRALSAMRGIRHVNTFYADWLQNLDYVRARRPDILWVGLTGRLSEDFDELLKTLGLPSHCSLPQDRVTAHRRLDTDPIWLSELAASNVRTWYAGDYAFMEHFFGPSWRHGQSQTPMSSGASLLARDEPGAASHVRAISADGR